AKCVQLHLVGKRARLCHRHFHPGADFPIDRRLPVPLLPPLPRHDNNRQERERSMDSVPSQAVTVDDFLLENMADLPLNDVSDEDQGIPRPNAFRSHSLNPSQETKCTEETSETGVQTDTPTAEEAHDYFLISKQCLLPLFTRCTECGNKEIETGTFQSRTVGSALVVQ
ncbi:hypothetical protein PENTCL1PPCAC_24140, partial [Pristionchus entomophagus]